MRAEKLSHIKAVGALGLSSLACRLSDLIFTNDPLMNAARGALSTAALGIEIFGFKPVGNVLNRDPAPLAILKSAAMLGLPLVAAAASYEFPAVGYVLMSLAFLTALTGGTSR